MHDETASVPDGYYLVTSDGEYKIAPAQNFAYICPVCGDFIECGLMSPITLGDDGTEYAPVCWRCNINLTVIDAVGKTHEEIDNEFKAECEKRGYTLVGAYPPIGGVIRQLAKWKEEENADRP